MKYSAKSLKDLLENGKPEKLSAIFEKKLPEINEAKRNGFSNEQIISALSNEGIKISATTFKNYLSRYKSTVFTKNQDEEIVAVKKTNSDEEISENQPRHTETISKDPDEIKKIYSSSKNIDSLSKLFDRIK